MKTMEDYLTAAPDQTMTVQTLAMMCQCANDKVLDMAKRNRWLLFDLGGWTVIDTVESYVTTFIQGDVTPLSNLVTGVRPITVGWRPATASGCIFYTSYHVEGASTGAPQELAIKYLVQTIATVCK